MENKRQPYYQRTINQINKGIKYNIEEAEETLVHMKRTKEKLENLEKKHRTCPLCNGKMNDISPLLDIVVLNGGQFADELHISRESAKYDLKRLPSSWECEKCYAFVTTEPDENAQLWTRDAIESNKKSMASILFEANSSINKVAYEPTKNRTGWLIRVANEWFYIEGLKKEIENALSAKV